MRVRAPLVLRPEALGSLFGKAFEHEWILAVRRKTWQSLQERDNHGFRLVVPPRDRYYADPFLFAHRGKSYIFFEDYRHSTRKGVISCMAIDSSGDLSKPFIVLEADTHLSYPFIFQINGQIYLMPETLQMSRVELYRCVRFPTDWAFDRVLMQEPATDATLWQQDGTLWLFANLSAVTRGRDCEDLHLFFSDSLDGKWSPHPKNPLVVDASGARPAGRLFSDRGELIRPAQDCSAGYGGGIVLKRILWLNRTEYREEPLARITAEWLPGAIGIHTIDHNQQFEVVDLKVPRLKTVARMAKAVRHSARTTHAGRQTPPAESIQS